MKRLFGLFLVLVVISGGWLYQQKPGHAYTVKNRVLHATKVSDSINIPLAQLSGAMTEQDVLQRYPDLGLDCGKESSKLGDRSCYASVRKVNGVDAWFVVFFFEKGRLSGLKLDIQPDGHAAMLNELHSLFGKGSETPGKRGSGPIIQWIGAQGAFGINKSAYADRPSQMLWVSMEKTLGAMYEKRRAQAQ